MSDTESRPPRSGEPVKPPGGRSWLRMPRKLYHFAVLSVSKAQADDLTQRSMALAFITIVSLIPLLAAFSFLGARWFDDRQGPMVEMLSQILPYSEQKIVAQMQQFLVQAKALRPVSFAIFILASVMVFTTIEETINRIWNVPRRRPFRSRLLSFTLVLFWGPVVIGTTFSGLFYLRRQIGFQALTDSLPVQLVPFAVTLLGLTMLYWLVPYTTVRFSAAFGGALTAAVLLEVLRQGFGIYVDTVQSISLVYGSFGLVLFFMISIQLSWWIVLLGSEAAYSLQNAAYVTRRLPAAPLEGSWIALAALVFVVERFRGGQPVTPHELLAERMQLKTIELRQVLAPLVDSGVLCESSGDTEGYLLACDPHDLEISRVFEIYEGAHCQLLEALPPRLANGLEDLRSRITVARDGRSEGIVLAQLAPAAPAEPEEAEVEAK